MTKKYIFRNSWNWLWLVFFFYLITFYTWYMHWSTGIFVYMARDSYPEPFSLWELTVRTWEHFQPSWWDVLWIIVPSGLGYFIFAWRKTWLTFMLPTLWLAISWYSYFILAFGDHGIGFLYTLRDFPNYWHCLPWWFKILTHLSIIG